MAEIITLPVFRAQIEAALTKCERLMKEIVGPGTLFPTILSQEHRSDLLATVLHDEPAVLLQVASESDDEARATLEVALMGLAALDKNLFDSAVRENVRRELYVLKCALERMKPAAEKAENDIWWNFYGGYQFDAEGMRRELYKLRSQVKERERAARAAKRAMKAAEGSAA